MEIRKTSEVIEKVEVEVKSLLDNIPDVNVVLIHKEILSDVLALLYKLKCIVEPHSLNDSPIMYFGCEKKDK